MSPKIKLTYFDIEAAGEPVRLALTLAKVPFEDERIKFPDWKELKPKMPGGQLPVMSIDDGPMMTQSKALLRFVGAEYSDFLYPRDKLYAIEEMVGIVEDIQRAFQPALMVGMKSAAVGYPDNFKETEEGKATIQKLRVVFVEKELPEWMDRLTKIMEGHGGPFLVAGDKPTVADCLAIPFLRGLSRGYIDFVDPKCLEKYPKIVEYIKGFCALDEIKGRYTSGVH